MQTAELNKEIVHDIAQFVADPLGFANYIYPWGEAELLDSAGPRNWQADLFEAIGEHLDNPATQYQPFRAAVSSGHGIGKSAFVGMFIHWAMSTCVDCRVVVTANSDPQLRTKTWPEVSKWFRLGLNSEWFDVHAESIKIKIPEHAELWRTDRLTWSINNPQAFAGLHNKGKRIVVIFDEASEIDDVIWEVTQGALTDENTEILWVVFGNPTQNVGRFAECFGRYSHRWQTRQIDSRTVEGTNKQEIEGWIKDFGEDSDYVRVRVKGEFPRASWNQFIPGDTVQAARLAEAKGFENLPKIMAIDVARFGDDQTVIGIRQGRKATILGKYRQKDTVETTQYAIDFIERERPNLVIVDGDGIGAGVVDNLKHRGFDVHEFHGGNEPHDKSMYFNRRAEVWGLLKDWLAEGADIPDDAELASDLTSPQYGFSPKQQIQLEKKEDMKKRGMRSPDCGDVFAMTFEMRLNISKQAMFEERLLHHISGIEDPTVKAIAARKIVAQHEKKMQNRGMVNSRSSGRARRWGSN